MEGEEETVFRQMFTALVMLRDRLRNQRSASLLIAQADEAIDAAKRVSQMDRKAT